MKTSCFDSTLIKFFNDDSVAIFIIAIRLPFNQESCLLITTPRNFVALELKQSL